MRGFACIVNVKESHGKRAFANRIEGHRSGMDQHGYVDAFKGASLEQENLATSIADFLGGCSDDLDGQVEIVGNLGRSNARSGRHGRHEIMPAGMPHLGQGIVLGADGYMERAIARSRTKGSWEFANTCLNLKTGIGKDLGDPAAGLLFGIAEFRVVV